MNKAAIALVFVLGIGFGPAALAQSPKDDTKQTTAAKSTGGKHTKSAKSTNTNKSGKKTKKTTATNQKKASK